MPTTVNGIGTHYYGKSNVETRQATCEFCGRSGELRTYDTRLWFCVVFLPVIPLGKKRILDECPGCTQHRQMSSGEWETARTSAIQEATAEYEADPKDPIKAISLHATLARGGERDAAERLAELIEKQFADNVDVQIYLGSCFEETDQLDRSNACFHRAHEIDPEYQGARHVSAVALLREGKAADARQRLEEEKAAGGATDPGIAFAVAGALHADNDSASASQMLREIGETTPEIRREKAFRKLAKDVESRTGETGSIAPPQAIWQAPAFWWSLLAAAVVAGLVAYDVHLSGSQPLFVVNGLPRAITVQLDNGEPISIVSNSFKRTEIAGGEHTVTVVDPPELAGETAFEVDSPRWRRWFAKPAHVLDPTHSAVLVWQETVFTDKPVDDDEELGQEVVFGETIHRFDHADYRFAPFPSEIEVDDTSARVIKSRVGIEEVEPMAVFMIDPSAMENPKSLGFIESRLLFEEDRESLLGLYTSVAYQQEAVGRACEFLASQLDAKPIDIHWHRIYQSLAESRGDEGLKERYESLLEKDPKDAVLLYLRARLENQYAAAKPYYQASLKAAPGNATVLVGAAYNAVAVGEFEAALDLVDRALASEPENDRAVDMRQRLLVATDQQAELEEELRETLEESPANFRAALAMMASQASRGAADGVSQTDQAYTRAIAEEWPHDPYELASRAHYASLMLLDREDEAATAGLAFTDETLRNNARFLTAAMGGDQETIGEIIAQLPEISRRDCWLWASLASQAKGNAEASADQRQRAIEAYSKSQGDGVEIARLLSGELSGERLASAAYGLVTEADIKAAVLLLVASEAGVSSDRLIELAERLSELPSDERSILKLALEAQPE